MSDQQKPVPQGQILPEPSKTGGIVSIPGQGMGMLPAAPDKCQVCATKHEPTEPHNVQSLPYGVLFYATYQRKPSWADAMAHCDLDMQLAWTNALRRDHNQVVPHEKAHEARLKEFAIQTKQQYIQPA